MNLEYFHNFMKFYKDSGLKGSRNVYNSLYPDITIRQRFSQWKQAGYYKVRIRYGHNGAGVTGYGDSVKDAFDMAQNHIQLLWRKVEDKKSYEKLIEKSQGFTAYVP